VLPLKRWSKLEWVLLCYVVVASLTILPMFNPGTTQEFAGIYYMLWVFPFSMVGLVVAEIAVPQLLESMVGLLVLTAGGIFLNTLLLRGILRRLGFDRDPEDRGKDD
jgi:hypothetical protein